VLARLLTPMFVFALGAATTFGVVTLEPARPAAPALRLVALARLDLPGADGAWEAAPQAGFAGGRIITAAWLDFPSCEAERQDARTLELTLAGGRAVRRSFEESTTAPEVSIIRLDGRAEALVVLRRSRWRGDDALTLLAWDQTTGAVEELASVDAERISWSLEPSGLTVRGVRAPIELSRAAMMMERRVGLTLRLAFTPR
jgi:hypothetical protein